MRRSNRLHASLAALAAVLVLAGSASAQSPLQEYQRTGRVTPCRYSSGQLNGGVPNDVAQYAPDYAQALRGAARANCGGGGGGGAATPGASGAAAAGAAGGPGGTGGAAAVNKPPAPPPVRGEATPARVSPAQTALPRQAHNSTPVPILLLGIVALAGLAAAALAATGRYLGWGGDTLAALRHALGELRWRAAGPFTGVR